MCTDALEASSQNGYVIILDTSVFENLHDKSVTIDEMSLLGSMKMKKSLVTEK